MHHIMRIIVNLDTVGCADGVIATDPNVA